jgi:hypothetical protein
VWAVPAGSVASCDRQFSESNVVHDHIRLRQRQIVAITCIGIGIGIGARHVKHTSPTEGGETMGGSSSSIQLSSGRGSVQMISDGCSDADGKVLVKCVAEHLLPTA